VKASNFKAIKLYEKLGFEQIGTHKNYFNINGEYDDEILMDLYL
jgi:RimJ/RimL family protein N-acetyltransferase